MSADLLSERPLFGGAISTSFPLRFKYVSCVRQVPDNEVLVDPARDRSLIFELLDFNHGVGDDGSAVWFLRDLAIELDGEGFALLEQSTVAEAPGLCYENIPAIVTTAFGQMVYLANIRLKEVGTDVLISAYETILINPLSKSASAVGAGLVTPAMQSGFMLMGEIFKVAVANFNVNDWGLFGPTV